MQAWLNFLAQLEKELGSETIQKWLKPLKVIKYDACNLYLEAKDSFQILWFEEHIRQKASVKFCNNNQKKIKIHLSVAGQSPPPRRIPSQSPEKKKGEKSLPQGFNLSFDELDPSCTFESFVVGENNLLPYKLLTQTAGFHFETNEQIAPELSLFNPIFLYGSSGSGKTHLLMATAAQLRLSGLRVIYARAESFTEHVVSAIRAGEMSLFRQAYRNIDALFIDDIHVFSKKGATQEELFHTFNTLHLAGKQIILSASCLPGELQFIEPRLVSRFEWGIVLPLHALSSQEIKEVIIKKTESLNFPLSLKAIDYLIETFPSGTKAICRAIEALVLRTHLSGGGSSIKYSSSQLTIPFIKNQLQDLIKEELNLAITPEKVLQKTAEHFGIKVEDILGKAQSRDCVLPRQLSMHLCRTELKMPFTKIGDFFGRDHSTVMTSVKAIQTALDDDNVEIASHWHHINKKVKAT